MIETRNITVLPDRACTVCSRFFTPRYRDKGFECSNRCHKLVFYRKHGYIPRSPEARKRDTVWMKEDRRKNRESYLKADRVYRERLRQKLGEAGWKERNKRYNLRKYGLTLDEFEKMLGQQNNRCAICGGPPRSKKGLHVDHNHATGEVRGLLCYLCNHAMAAVDQTDNWCEKAAEYAAGEKG